jgi:predicted O-methyltransferase YrrM
VNNFELSLILLLLFSVGIGGVAFYKIYKAYSMLYLLRTNIQQVTLALDTHFRQIESLFGLYRELNLKHGLPHTRGWAGSPDYLQEIANYILSVRPAVVVECGSGVSSVVIARCLQLNGVGRLISLEHNENYAKNTDAELRRHEIAEFATTISRPLREYQLNGRQWTWYSIEGLPDSIDMLIVDGPPASIGENARYPAGPLLFERLKVGGTVFLDDMIREDEKGIYRMWQRDYPFFAEDYRQCEKGCLVLTRLR